MVVGHASSQEPGEYSPDFILAHRDVIHEETWGEWEAQGFFPVITIDVSNVPPSLFSLMQDIYGAENVYTGDAYDKRERRPLRHNPGYSIYSSPAGQAYMEKRHPRSDDHASDDPATN